MIARVPRTALVELGALVERHLRAHGWDGVGSVGEVLLLSTELAGLLLEGLAYVRERHPWIGRRGAVIEPPEAYAPELLGALADALLKLDEDPEVPATLDACLDALAAVVPFEVSDAAAGRREAAPRAYPFSPVDWPSALADVSSSERVFGIIAEDDWLRDRARRQPALRAALPWMYDEATLVELDAGTAQGVARALFAGHDNRGASAAYREQAKAWVRLFGPATRAFATRDFDLDELRDPFAHVEPSAWYALDHRGDSYCCGGHALALVVTDGLRAAILDAVWDSWSE
jgi:hypothetical protein